MKYDWASLTSRSKDALVAQHVMGKTVNHIEDDYGDYGWYEAAMDSDVEAWVSVDEYTTDIAAAWTIVEHMRTRKYMVHLDTTLGDGGEIYGWRCSVYDYLGTGRCWTIESTTAPDAISLAALRAVGVDV